MCPLKVIAVPHQMTAEYNRAHLPLTNWSNNKHVRIPCPSCIVFYDLTSESVSYCLPLCHHRSAVVSMGRAKSQHWSIGKILKKFRRSFYKTTVFPVLHHWLAMLFTGEACAHCKEAFCSQGRASFPQGLL